MNRMIRYEELDGSAASELGVRTEVKQCSQRSVIGWVIKNFYHELLRGSEGTLWVPAVFAAVRTKACVVGYGL
jgi:hypothetical protein